MQIIGYINFPGNTREAMNFYKECLGGELTLMTIGGSPIEGHMPADRHNDILHSSLEKDGMSLLASDMMTKDEITVGNNVSLMLNCASEEETYRVYESLSAGGKATYPVKPAFWGGLFGNLVDKYGINWSIHFPAES